MGLQVVQRMGNLSEKFKILHEEGPSFLRQKIYSNSTEVNVPRCLFCRQAKRERDLLYKELQGSVTTLLSVLSYTNQGTEEESGWVMIS